MQCIMQVCQCQLSYLLLLQFKFVVDVSCVLLYDHEFTVNFSVFTANNNDFIHFLATKYLQPYL